MELGGADEPKPKTKSEMFGGERDGGWTHSRKI